MPVAPLFDGSLFTKHVILLPDHQVSGTGGNGTFAFGALVGLDSVERRNVLNEPLSIPCPLDIGCRV